MRTYLFLPVLLGAFAVIQGVLNRKIAGGVGLANATLINNFVLLGLGFLLVAFVRFGPPLLPGLFSAQSESWSTPWWIVIPGLCGFCLVTGLPLAISKIGASTTFILLIGAQIVVSLVWDAAVEKKEIALTQVLGAILVFGGAALTMKGK